MNWQDVINDESLQNLPYKIETNGDGDILMSPASNMHGIFQSKISNLINKYKNDGETATECSIETVEGTKVADVAWISNEFLKRYGYQTPYNTGPEICVEVISPSNTPKKIDKKIALYFSKGAKEVWVCDESGNMEFHTPEGKIKKSKIIPKFPKKVKIKKFE